MLFFNRGKTFGLIGTILAIAWLNRKHLRDLRRHIPRPELARDERKGFPDVPTSREIQPEFEQYGAPAVDPGLVMQQDFKNAL